MTIERIDVELEPASRSYQIHIGEGALHASMQELADLCPRGVLPLITDQNVADLHLERLESLFAGAGVEVRSLILPPGESQKSFDGLAEVCNFLLEQDVERDDCIAAFGGGVIGDLTGLASALVKRGTGFVQIPTTLLSQVDSSVGGKTAINAAMGKNMIGVFHQPKMVIADLGFLQTLDPRQVRAGYAEMLKMACLSDAEFFIWLEAYGPDVLALAPDKLSYAIARSVTGKARIVAEDEFEHGRRALLNLGHTFGHALETEAKGALLHGEAVAAGMGAAFSLSVKLGLCESADQVRLHAHLQQMGLPVSLSNAPGSPFQVSRILERMRADKKNQLGQIHLVLARSLGEAMVHSDLSEEQILEFLEEELGA